MLFPALIVGVGQVGLTFVRTLRQLIADRFGKPTLPHLRWLYLDTDPAGGDAAVAAPAATAPSRPRTCSSPDSVARRTILTREGLPAVDTWLPQEELFRMPKTPVTEGVRGLGRLALCDHYHVVCHRSSGRPWRRSSRRPRSRRRTS